MVGEYTVKQNEFKPHINKLDTLQSYKLAFTTLVFLNKMKSMWDLTALTRHLGLN